MIESLDSLVFFREIKLTQKGDIIMAGENTPEVKKDETVGDKLKHVGSSISGFFKKVVTCNGKLCGSSNNDAKPTTPRPGA